MLRARLLRALLVIDAGVLLRILWWPVDTNPAASPWWLRWALFNDIPGGHYLLNCFLLVPTAVLMTMLWPQLSVRRVTLLCLAISGLAEAGQFFVPTRMPDLLDVLSNTLGACIAAWVVAHVAKPDGSPTAPSRGLKEP